MKHVKSYKLFEMARNSSGSMTPEAIKWLDRYTWRRRKGGNWSINPQTGLIDVQGDFLCDKLKNESTIEKLPVSFGVVTGNFDCSDLEMLTLEGSPQEVGGYFKCSRNRINSLIGAPRKVGGYFDCSDWGVISRSHKITSLEGAPQEVGGDFDCSSNRITSLKGAPQKVGGSFHCHSNLIHSLEGAPSEVGGIFTCHNNLLETLKGAPKTINVGQAFVCKQNPLKSIEDAPLGDYQFRCDAFECEHFTLKDKLDLLSSEQHYTNRYAPVMVMNPELTKKLILPLISPDILDAHMMSNPLDMDLLDGVPEIKAEVLKRTGIKDVSSLARSMRRGLI